MAKSILITGGARSGKSRFAERVTLHLGTPALYIATAEGHDAEMADRIARHRARRGAEWQDTINAPTGLAEALVETDGGLPRLVDCLTLWLSNVMLASDTEVDAVSGNWLTEAEALAAVIERQTAPVVFVTNEVGAGIVPATSLGRAYRDAAGRTNQIIAEACDEVYLVVAGQPLKVKPNDTLPV